MKSCFDQFEDIRASQFQTKLTLAFYQNKKIIGVDPSHKYLQANEKRANFG